jgi:transcriptional repressor NrdR
MLAMRSAPAAESQPRLRQNAELAISPTAAILPTPKIMRCPKCGSSQDKVIDSREAREGQAIRRRRECMRCNFRFTTYEIVEREELRVVKRNGAPQNFDREKLRSGLRKACEKRPVKMEQIDQMTDDIANELEEEGYREIPSTVIGAKVMRHLEAVDHVAYVRYASVYRQFEDVGEFIDEIKGLDSRRTRDTGQEELFR